MKGFSGFGNSPAKQTIKMGSHGDIHKTDKVKQENKTKQKNSGPQDTKENREIMKRLVKERNEPRKITYPEVPKGQEEFREVKYVKVKSPAKQEGPIPKKNIKLQKGEMEGTWLYEGKDKSERIIDLEERAGFLTDNDIPDLEGSKDPKDIARLKQLKKTAKKLQHEAAILRNRKPNKK